MTSTSMSAKVLAILLLLGATAASAKKPSVPKAPDPKCDRDNAGITLPAGFCALPVSEGVGPARHLAVSANGDIYVALSTPLPGGGIVALRDTNGDGRADIMQAFGGIGGTGIRLRGTYLYLGRDTEIVRFRLNPPALVPEGPPETIVRDFPEQATHKTKSFAFDNDENVFVDVGAPSNVCQKTGSKQGQDACPQLALQAGIWRYKADLPDQTHKDAARFATGIRNAVAVDWDPATKQLYVVQHGRDQLSQLWPDLYTAQQSAELPAEEFLHVEPGADYGWPYCYYDQLQGRKVLAPEYGGNGKTVGRCENARNPVLAFPGHWAPNDLLFYAGKQFPARYHGGAFVAFHGSWNRAPLLQRGYNVAFVPFREGRPAGGYEIFADGFAGKAQIRSPQEAKARPMGLAQGPDGSLYIADSVSGKIWRVFFTGEH